MTDTKQLEEQIRHMFASAWQDGVNHLDPKYLRRDTLFTEKVMQLITAAETAARIDELTFADNLCHFHELTDRIKHLQNQTGGSAE